MDTEKETIRKPFEIEVTSKSWAYGGHAQGKEEDIELVNVHIKTKDPLDCVTLAHIVAFTLKDRLKKEPTVKILP